MIKACSLWVFDLVVLHLSEPYSKTDLTLVLKILILLWRERAEEFQMGRRVLTSVIFFGVLSSPLVLYCFI